MRIGVDYYPEHWPEERWPRDIELMKAAGVEAVRMAEFAWSRMEPHEGDYQFEWLERIVDMMHASGIESVLGTPTATPPAWLHQRYPDVYPADTRGYRLGFGTRLQRCLNNPTMRDYSRRITRELAKRFGRRDGVAGWQTDNEFTANLCYCPVCADKFRDWLRAKYGTVEELNAAWGTVFWSQEYTSFSQVPLPWQAKCGTAHNPSLQLEFRRFQSQAAIDFQREQVLLLRHYSPGRFITHNFMGLHDSMDYYRLADDLDFVSWDNYPITPWPSNELYAPLAHDVTRGLKGQPFWVMEEQAGVTGWQTMSRRPAPGQLRCWAWQAAAHGAETIVFFRWRSCLYGTEQYWHGVLNHDGRPRRRYQEVAGLARELRELSPLVDGSEHRNPVAILNSYDQHYAMQIQPQTEGLDLWGQALRYYEALRAAGVGVDVVPMREDLSPYQVVIAPSLYLVTPRDRDILGAYVEQGGTLVLNPRSGVKDELNACRAEPLPALLADLTGVEVDDYDPLGPAEVAMRMNGQTYAASVWSDALRLNGADPVAVYESGHFPGEPAVTRNKYGQGAAYYAGAFGEPRFYRDFLAGVLEDAGVETCGPVPEGVDIQWRYKDGAKLMFVINTRAESAQAPAPAGAALLLGDPPHDGALRLAPYAAAVLKL